MSALARVRRAGGGLLTVVCVAAAGIVTSSCATGGVSSQQAAIWREDMGRITRVTLETGLDKVVRKHALQIARVQDSSREIFYETLWMNREVLAEEEVRGISNARNRIVLKGRMTGAEMGMEGVYRVTWELENEVTSATAQGWHPDVVPDEVVEDFRRIYSDLMLEVRTGLIR